MPCLSLTLFGLLLYLEIERHNTDNVGTSWGLVFKSVLLVISDPYRWSRWLDSDRSKLISVFKSRIESKKQTPTSAFVAFFLWAGLGLILG